MYQPMYKRNTDYDPTRDYGRHDDDVLPPRLQQLIDQMRNQRQGIQHALTSDRTPTGQPYTPPVGMALAPNRNPQGQPYTPRGMALTPNPNPTGTQTGPLFPGRTVADFQGRFGAGGAQPVKSGQYLQGAGMSPSLHARMRYLQMI